MTEKTTDGVRLEAARMLKSDGKIEAIKFVREKTGLGLAQAKAFVEALQSGKDPDQAARSVETGSSGCLPIVLALLATAAAIWWVMRS